MATAYYETGRSLAFRQDLSGSVQYLGDIHGSNESIDKSGVERVQLIQPGQRVVTQETKSSYIPIGLEILQDVDKFVIKQNYESEGKTSNQSLNHLLIDLNGEKIILQSENN